MPSAAILTGGHARRFGGRDKSTLLVEGRTILERLMDALGPLTNDIMLIGRSAVTSTAGAGLRAVQDRTPDRGPLGGLEAALAEAREAPVLLLACDMPFVTTDLLARLVALASGMDAAVPRTARGVHPLCAAYNPSCRQAVERQLAAGRLAMVDLVTGLKVQVLEDAELREFGDPHRLLANVNTPGEYASLAEPPGHHNR